MFLKKPARLLASILAPARRRFVLLSAVLVALNAAGILWIHHDLTNLPKPRLRVLSALPQDGVAKADRLTFVFDQPLAPPGGVGKAPEFPLMVISPAPKGKWVWSSEDRLEYVLDEPLPPGRVFLVKFADDLEARTGRRVAGEKSFRFETDSLELNESHLLSADRLEVTFELAFNQLVDGQELLRRMEVREVKSGQRIEPVLLTQKPAAKMVFRCRRPAGNVLELAVGAELTGFEGQLPLGERVVRRLGVPEAFCLLRAEAYSQRLDKDIAVRLAFSSSLDRRQALPAVRVEPPVADLRTEWSYDALYLRGPLECGKRYKVTVPATLLSHEGKTLGADQSTTFDVPDRQPGVRFDVTNGILSPLGNLELDLTVVNTAKVTLSAYRLHANNLVPHLHGHADEDEVGREVLNKTIDLDLPRNQLKTFAVDLRSLLKSPRGVYRLSANAGRYRYDAAENNVCISDLALTAKTHRDGVTAWVTSLREGKGLAGVKVTAISKNNQPLATATTGPDGLADLAVPPKHPDGPAWVLTAELKDDLSYLKLGENRWMIESCEQTGRPYPQTYEVMLYTERGIYRPGDTVHVTGLIRDASGRVPPPFPLAVRVIRPDGREIADLAVSPKALAGQGAFHVEQATGENDATGFYRFVAHLPGAKESLGEVAAMVEAYVPVRMEVKATPSAARVGPGEDASLHVSAKYLWGQPASELPLVVRGEFVAAAYQSKKYPKFSFADGRAEESFALPERTLALGDNGLADVPLALDKKKIKTPRLWRGSIAASVTETGGRSVSANATILIDQLDRHIGLRTASTLAGVDKPVRVEYVTLSGTDEPVGPEGLEMTLSRVEYDTVLREVNGQMTWKSVERLVAVVKPRKLQGKALETDKNIRCTELTCDSPGRYRLAVTELGSPVRGQLEFYVSQSGDDTASLSMNEPEELEIVLDRERYEPGSTAKVLVRSPIAGTMLLTLESDRILHRRIVQITQRTAQVELAVPENLRGGAFVSASVVRPVDPTRKEWLPHRAMGMAKLVCDHSGNELPLAIAAPDKVQPGQSIDVTVDTHMISDPVRPAVVHLWAVDEGILLTTGFETPDPLDYFLSPRAAAIQTCDSFFELLPDYQRPKGMARIGADGGGDMPAKSAMRRSTVPLRQKAAGVVWATCGTVDMNGRFKATLKLPDLTGRMRLMATLADGDLYGSARHDVTVTAPLLVEASWPRFAAPGDRFQVPLKLFNSSDRELAVKVDLDLHGPVAIAGGDDLSKVVVPKGGSVVKFVDLRADAPGQVEARCNAVEIGPGGLAAHCDALLAVRPATTPHAVSRIVTAEAGQDVDLPPDDSFVPGTTLTRLVVSGRPSLQLRPALEQLLAYPYGCVEQTTSRLAAILYTPDLIAMEAGADDVRAAHARQMVESGIFRLWSMQTPSGGLGYWPGDRKANLWGTAYAAELLIQAKLAGYRVDPRFMDELMKYLEQTLQQTRGGEELPDFSGRPSQNLRAMILHLLALNGRPQHGWMARLAERLDELDMGGRAHLAGAYLAIGRKDRAMAVLPRQTIEMTAVTTTSGELTTQIRQDALLLGVLLDLDPANPWVDLLAGKLEKGRTQGHWGTTLSNASALTALARYQLKRAGQPSQFTGTVRAGEGQGKSFAFDQSKPVVCSFKALAQPIQVRSSGTGRVFLHLTTEGQAREGVVKPFARNVFLQRRWLDRKGNPIAGDRLKVGDLVQVELTIGLTGMDHSVGNVAIVDALPGGLEVENPRLMTAAALPMPGPARPRGGEDANDNDSDNDNANDADSNNGEAQVVPTPAPAVASARVMIGRADRSEFLDDRVLLFATVGPTRQVFRYTLRATTAGSFAVPPVQASCMYEPAVAALGEGGSLVVSRQ